MAALSVQDRSRIWRGLMRRWSNDRVPCGLSKQELYDPGADTGVVADLDNWVDTHQGTTTADNVGMNGALNVNARAALTAEMKTDVLIAIVAMRRGLGYLKSVFGEVD